MSKSAENDPPGARRAAEVAAERLRIIKDQFVPYDDDTPVDVLREAIRLRAAVINDSLLWLGPALDRVDALDLYRAWGYSSVNHYAEVELGLSAAEVKAKRRIHSYLVKHQPEIIEAGVMPPGAPPPGVLRLVSKAVDTGALPAKALAEIQPELNSPDLSDLAKSILLKERIKEEKQATRPSDSDAIARAIGHLRQLDRLIPNLPLLSRKHKEDWAEFTETFGRVLAKLLEAA